MVYRRGAGTGPWRWPQGAGSWILRQAVLPGKLKGADTGAPWIYHMGKLRQARAAIARFGVD